MFKMILNNINTLTLKTLILQLSMMKSYNYLQIISIR